LDSKTLGARIRQAREHANLTQEALAERTSKDQRAVSEYESGKRRLSAIDLPTFATALNVPLLYFFEGELSEQDLDRVVLTEFHHLPTFEAKQSAIEFVQMLSKVISFHLRPFNHQ
jgi:transcriptional regulator with XRE-family HTH domain